MKRPVLKSEWGKFLDQARSRQDLIAVLEAAEQDLGYIPDGLMAELAEKLEIPLGDVYGVATFYSFLSVKPQGKHTIRVCKSLPCCLKNAETIIKAVEKELGIRPGETTGDGKFSLCLTNCIGACDDSPAIMVDDNVHTGLTPDNVKGILKAYN